ncbi:MAG: hypothetical protein A2X08_06560 [Bacteroidetes bacterium GWA2_32_17]|nr:MAG: hypothetical protein A2X08_06560 [Bacteroidetes bacterium GWA2_32_17]
MRFLIFLILFFLIGITCKAQDTIWFLSGERLITSNYTLKTEDGLLTYFKGKKEKKVGLEYVFSVHEKNGYEKVFYEPTSIENTPFSVEQMRSFIKGEFEASEHYKATGATIIGVTAGIGGIYLFPILNAPVFWSPVLPTGTSAIIGSTNICEKKIIKKFPQYTNDEYFISGYSEIVKQKRISHSIVGGVIGLAVGVVSALIIKP